jgi:hypothetical protein
MIPDSLVLLKSYAAEESFAVEPDRQLLAQAGIETHLKHLSRYGALGSAVELWVAAADAEAAQALLRQERQARGAEPDDSDSQRLRCPCCSSTAVTARPPYVLVPVLAGVAAGVLAAMKGQVVYAVIAMLVGFAAGGVVLMLRDPWRCTDCGQLFRDPFR